MSDILFVGQDNKKIENFISGLQEIISNKEYDKKEFQKKINIYLNRRKKIKYVDDAVLTDLGNKLICNGENEKGIVLLKAALNRASEGEYTDGITLFLRLAEYEFMHGNEENGIKYLTHVCEDEASNYEQAIEFRDLTNIWQKYKLYVEGKVRESYENTIKTTKSPSECTIQIQDILDNTDKNKLLYNLLQHINELCADGDSLNNLNKWERNIFYLDLLWSEVNSGGFEAFLISYGNYFERIIKASIETEILELKELLDNIKNIFPNRKIPKSEGRMEAVINKHELEFEEFDHKFYEEINDLMAEKLLMYIDVNKERFR